MGPRKNLYGRDVMNWPGLVVLTLGLILQSCAHRGGQLKKLDQTSGKYRLQDQSGKYLLQRSGKLDDKQKLYAVERRVYNPQSQSGGKVVEKTLTVSKLGYLGKRKLPVMRPFMSKYVVWFEGKKYKSTLKLDPKKREIKAEFKSEEKKWNGEKVFKAPMGNSLFCFYFQVVECLNYSGFIKESIKGGIGLLNFTLIWEGHPFFGQQYINIPENVFSNAQISYEGPRGEGEHQFLVEAQNHSFSIVVDDKGRFKKKFWIGQGLSIIGLNR